MARSKNPVNPDEGTGPGQARTRRARREVIDAAAALFIEVGYPTTTIAALSVRSAVPQATIYRLFGSKPGILKAWLDEVIAGDDAPVAVADRAPVVAAMATADPRDLVAGFVAVTIAINGRIGRAYGVLIGAAETDHEAAELLARIRRQRAAGQRNLSRALERRGALRAGLTERSAADIVYTLLSPETYRSLVVERRWSARRHRDWLVDVLGQQLLG